MSGLERGGERRPRPRFNASPGPGRSRKRRGASRKERDPSSGPSVQHYDRSGGSCPWGWRAKSSPWKRGTREDLKDADTGTGETGSLKMKLQDRRPQVPVSSSLLFLITPLACGGVGARPCHENDNRLLARISSASAPAPVKSRCISRSRRSR